MITKKYTDSGPGLLKIPVSFETKQMKVLVVSGFLGAGKTTFIKTMAQCSGQDFCILENEYGEVDVDTALLKEETENITVWEMTEGCICCSMKQSFASSLLTISGALDPEYLIVEATGVGLLSNILANISQIEYDRIVLLRPVTIVDAGTYFYYQNKFDTTFQDQIQAAGTILLSKGEHMSARELEEIRRDLRRMNPAADIVTEPYSEKPVRWWKDLLSAGMDGRKISAPGKESSAGWENIGLRNVRLSSPEELLYLLWEAISGNLGAVVRGKGILPCGKEWLRFDITDSRFSITGTEPSKESSVVFIGMQLKKNQIRRSFQFRISSEQDCDQSDRK